MVECPSVFSCGAELVALGRLFGGSSQVSGAEKRKRRGEESLGVHVVAALLPSFKLNAPEERK